MKRELDPHTKDRREPLEILAMLSGRTNFPRMRGPGATRAQQPITPLDVAHAVACGWITRITERMDEDAIERLRIEAMLSTAVAMSITCQRENEWGTVHKLSYPKLLSELQQQRAFPGVVQGPKRFRVRIVLYDAFHDLIWPAKRQPIRIASKEAGMEKRAYGFLHHHITGFLHTRAHTAALDACIYLFSQITRAPQAEGPTPLLAISGEQNPEKATPPSDFDSIIDVLLADVVRSPRPGILHLSHSRAPSLS